MKMGSPAETVVRDLAAAFPSLQPLMDGHIDDYDEVLPHVFLGDVHRYVADTLNGDDDASASDVQGIIDFLEDRFRRGEDTVRELISVSFVELLPRPGERGAHVRTMLGPELSAEARRVGE